jgi:hypothetical protein
MNAERKYKPESELREIARSISERDIFIRVYDNGNSDDIKRKPRKAERDLIYRLAWGTLLGLNSGESVRKNKNEEYGIVNTAEYILVTTLTGIKLPEREIDEEAHINTYLSFYLPIMNALDDWRIYDHT